LLAKLIYIHNNTDMIFDPTCYERPPFLRDRFCCTEGPVAHGRFYCIRLQLLKYVFNFMCFNFTHNQTVQKQHYFT